MDRLSLTADSKSRASLRLMRLAAVPLLAITLTLAACGGSGGSTTDYPTGSSDVVLQISVGGGFVPVEYNLTQIPGFTLYGDGTVIVTGPMIEIYPQPAMPNLQTATISKQAIQEILSAAQEAGLFANDVDYGQPGITDVPTTTITISAGGKTYVSNIYALGMEQGAGGLTMQQQEARAAINEFAGQVGELTAFQTGEIEWSQYAFKALAVFSLPFDPSTAPDGIEVQPNRLEWPLADLDKSGQAVQPDGYRKVVVSGDELDTLRPLLDQATQITLWKSGDTEYHLFFRPLLPNETE